MASGARHGPNLNLEHGGIKEQHEVADHTQHPARVHWVVAFSKVLGQDLYIAHCANLILLHAGSHCLSSP